jgi:type 1 glutamine amidotransferase
MRKNTSLLWILAVALAVAILGGTSPAQAATPKKGKLLYMTLTKGFHHESIELSKQILKEIGEKSGAFDVTVTEDVAAFTTENLKNYDAVMFNTTGELPMDDAEKKAFMDFVRSGHGFVAVHSATDTFYMWGEFGELIGGYFNGHPWHQMVTIEVADPTSPLVNFLGKSFQINDEIYQISDFQAKDCHVLLRLAPSADDLKKPGVMRRYYGWPVAWTRRFGKGRVYYNGLGHDDWVWKDPRYQEMLLKGIQWAMGLSE